MLWLEMEDKISNYCRNKIKSSISKELAFLENKKKGKLMERGFGPMHSVIFAADGMTYWCTEFRGSKEYALGSWKKDGYKSIFKSKLVNEMMNFEQYHKCAIQCKYHDCFNQVPEPIKEFQRNNYER
jgi:radical SAM protein with 4Fe4S-binding SPASM domain